MIILKFKNDFKVDNISTLKSSYYRIVFLLYLIIYGFSIWYFEPYNLSKQIQNDIYSEFKPLLFILFSCLYFYLPTLINNIKLAKKKKQIELNYKYLIKSIQENTTIINNINQINNSIQKELFNKIELEEEYRRSIYKLINNPRLNLKEIQCLIKYKDIFLAIECNYRNEIIKLSHYKYNQNKEIIMLNFDSKIEKFTGIENLIKSFMYCYSQEIIDNN